MEIFIWLTMTRWTQTTFFGNIRLVSCADAMYRAPTTNYYYDGNCHMTHYDSVDVNNPLFLPNWLH